MTLPVRTVKYVVRGALQEMAEETPQSQAPDRAYDDVFNAYIDMLISWQNQGILSGLAFPENINAPLANTVPAQDLIYMLTKYAAGKYQYALTALQMGGYSKAYNDLMVGQPKISIASNPIPHGYSRYNRWPTNCCDDLSQEFHDDCEQPLISNDNTVLVSGN